MLVSTFTVKVWNQSGCLKVVVFGNSMLMFAGFSTWVPSSTNTACACPLVGVYLILVTFITLALYKVYVVELDCVMSEGSTCIAPRPL